MCRKLALAATILSLSAGAVLAAPAPAAQPQAPAAGAPAQAAAPVQAPQPYRPTAEQQAEADRLDPLARAAFWGHVLENEPRDTVAGVKIARALREMGRFDEAAQAADKVLVIEPDNLDGLLEAARARIGQNQGFFAIEPAEHASRLAPRDWRPHALRAVALEQAQRDDEALAAHQRALQLAPDNPATLSNLAMYYASHGQTADAEALLRKAVALPTATAQVRQNLALILGLEGRLDEAERLERRDLPPAIVANNMSYLRAAQAPTTERSWTGVQSAP